MSEGPKSRRGHVPFRALGIAGGRFGQAGKFGRFAQAGRFGPSGTVRAEGQVGEAGQEAGQEGIPRQAMHASDPAGMHASFGPTLRDLRYSERSAHNTLDLYLPANTKMPPVVMWLHGGAFCSGDKANPRGLKYFLPAGIAVAAMNYRLAPDAIWPAQLDDLRDAFSYLRASAEGFGIDATRIASFGVSAGGHLSAMAAIDFARDPATRLCASVIWHPPIDFPTMDEDMAASGIERWGGQSSAPDSPLSALMGVDIGKNPEMAREASPIRHLERLPAGTPLPALLIQHGLKDDRIAAGQSRRLHAAFDKHGTSPRLELDLLPDGSHGRGSFAEPAIAVRVIEFLKQSFQA